MSTITPAAGTPVSGAFATNPAYSGTFIPAIWSGKLIANFYAASTFADVCNRDYEGDIRSLGDKVVINTTPALTINDYVIGTNLTYGVPTPGKIELNIDKAKYFAYQVNDVLEYQSKPDLMDTFTGDAGERMRVAIDSNCWYSTFSDADAANKGATAGVGSGAYNLGTDAAPVVLTATNILETILGMASVLDEQNIPNEGRYLVIDPATRTLLLQSELRQAYLTGDAKSPLRNGLIGEIDRFKVYVTNLLPRATAATNAPWISGDGSQNTITSTGGPRRLLVAGHRSAMTFASQITKSEQVRNPNDFGDYVRSLQVYGVKTVQPKSLTVAVVA